jgi:hypothetical protein
VFSNATGIEQNAIDFKTDTGDHYVFDNLGNRITSDTDAQKYVKQQFGLDVSPEEAQVLAGAKYGQEDEQAARLIAQQKVEEKLKGYGYRLPSEEVLNSVIQPGTNVLENVDQLVDPYYVAEDEVKAFFNQTVGRDPTPEELVQFIGAKSEADTLGERQARELETFNALTNLFGLTNVAQEKAPWEVDINGFNPESDVPMLDETFVTASPEEDIPSLNETFVTASPEEEL